MLYAEHIEVGPRAQKINENAFLFVYSKKILYFEDSQCAKTVIKYLVSKVGDGVDFINIYSSKAPPENFDAILLYLKKDTFKDSGKKL